MGSERRTLPRPPPLQRCGQFEELLLALFLDYFAFPNFTTFEFSAVDKEFPIS